MKRPGIRRQNAIRNHALLALAMADPTLSSTAKCILTVLLFVFLNGKTGLCNPSFKRIGEAVGLKRRAIVAAVQELKKAGWVTYEGTEGGSPQNTNRFAFCSDRLPSATGAKNDTGSGAQNDTGASDDTGAPNVSTGARNRTLTTEEPLAEGQGGSSNHRDARTRPPNGAAPRQWRAHEKTLGDIAREYAAGAGK